MITASSSAGHQPAASGPPQAAARPSTWVVLVGLAILVVGGILWYQGAFSPRPRVALVTASAGPYWDLIVNGAQHAIDLIKIESRPLRERPWEYYFFLDLRGHRTDRRVARALAAVARRALRAKVLGSYPAATPG